MSNFDKPIEGEICGMSLEAYRLAVQLLADVGCIDAIEARQIIHYVQLDPNGPHFQLEVPRIIHRACTRWIMANPEKTLTDDGRLMNIVVRKLRQTTELEIRKAVS